jgi:hypothetical protein
MYENVLDMYESDLSSCSRTDKHTSYTWSKRYKRIIKMINKVCIHSADIQRYVCKHGFLLPKVEKFTVEKKYKFS